MVYSTDGAKWKAYQFSDPFAAGAFVVCNKINKEFCRPDCDARPITNLKAEIKFMPLASEAIGHGYEACSHCDPVNMQAVDVNLLINCVTTVNKQIGFLTPLLDENEDRNNEKIKENIIELKKDSVARRYSLPVVSLDGKYPKDFEATSISKNDSDHYKLVDLACRHLALAAAATVFQQNLPKIPSSPEEAGSPGNGKKRRRRGGVLGFKELAAKSKLSAWHFHRVFKSVTGLTPKTYGDKCSEYLNTVKSSPRALNASTTSVIESPVYRTPLSSVTESDSHPTSPENSAALTIPTVFTQNGTTSNTSNKKRKLDSRVPQQNVDEGLFLSAGKLSDPLFQTSHSFNDFNAPMFSQEQIPQVPSQASFDMNFPAQQVPSETAFGATFGEGMLNNYMNSFKSDVPSIETPFMSQAIQPVHETSNFDGTNPSLFEPIENSSYEGSPLSSTVGIDLNNNNNNNIPVENINNDIPYFDPNDLSNQFLNTGFEEPQMPLEEYSIGLANEIF